MFLLDISYIDTVERADALLDDHIAWLKQGRADGHFVAWGGKKPRTGGLVLAKGTREEVEALAQRDPYVANGVAEVKITEFRMVFAEEGLEALTQ